MQNMDMIKVWVSSVLNREKITSRLNNFWIIDLSKYCYIRILPKNIY